MAIELDATAAARGPSGATPNVWSHTVSAGSNMALVVATIGPPDSGSYGSPTVTWNSSASLTEIAHVSVSNSTTDWFIALWYLLAPTPGTHDVTFTSTNSLGAASVSYAGVDQNAISGASANSGGSNVSTKTFTRTVNTANSWLVLGFRDFSSDWVAGTSATMEALGNSSYVKIADSAGGVPTGSQSLTMDGGTTNLVGGIIATLEPAFTGPTYSVSAENGAFTYAGQDTSLLYYRIMTAGTGSFTYAGQSAVLAKGYMISAGTGTYTLSSVATELDYSGFENIDKPSTTWTNISGDATSWTDVSIV